MLHQIFARRALAALCLASISLPAMAATPISQTRPLDARGRVEIENLKGKVERGSRREYGRTPIKIVKKHPLFVDDPAESVVWMSHGDQVTRPPKGFDVLAESENTPITAIANEERELYGVQFHPESVLTTSGKTILNNFLGVTAAAHAV